MSAPTTAYAVVQSNFFRILGHHMDDTQFGKLLGRCCYALPLAHHSDTLLCPDLSYVSPIRLLNAKQRGEHPILAPELVIEIAGTEDTHEHMENKARVYLQAGVHLLWIAWPGERSIEVWQPGDDPVSLSATDTLEGGTVIPGFSAPVGAFFEQ